MPTAIELLADSSTFRAATVPQAIIDRDFRFCGVNTAFEVVTAHPRSLLLGERMFDVFPDNQADPGAGGGPQMAASLESVLRRGEPHRMPLQRHDIPDASTPNRFVYKIWAPTNRPLRDARGRTVAVLHQTEDVTELLTAAAAAANAPDGGGAAVRALLHEHEASLLLRRQVDTLGEALESSRLISVAVGLVMAECGLGREAAFQWLVASSQKAHRKLRDVADDLVRDFEAGGGQCG